MMRVVSAVDTIGVTEQVNVNSAEEDGNDSSPSVQHPGSARTAGLSCSRSDSANLVPNDTNDGFRCVRPRPSGRHDRRVSVSEQGQSRAPFGAASLGRQSISADGRYVTFSSTCLNSSAGTMTPEFDVFVHDRLTGATTRVSVASDGTDASGLSAAISGDGRFVGFRSDSAVLNGPGFFSDFHVFVHDRATGVTERINEAPTVRRPTATLRSPQLSADGRFVFFSSLGDEPRARGGRRDDGLDAFLFDRPTGTMTAITSTIRLALRSHHQTRPHPGASAPTDGYLTFTARSDGFIEPDTNGFNDDVWLVDTQTDPFTYTLVSRNDAGEQANEISNCRTGQQRRQPGGLRVSGHQPRRPGPVRVPRLPARPAGRARPGGQYGSRRR